MQLPAIKYSNSLNDLLVKYHRSFNHPLKLRVIKYLEKLFGTKRLVVKTVYGFKFSIDKEDLIQRSVLEHLVWEKDLSKFYKENLNDNDIFFDIGANVGYFSCLALSTNVKSVVSFEPDSTNTEILEFNFSINKFNSSKYSILNIAVGEHNDKAIFYRGNTANTGISSLIKNYDEYESQFEVDVKSLDSLFDSGLSLPTVLKIDTEGYELNVLKGARLLLKNNPPRIIVFEANTIDEFNALKSYLESYNYIYFIELKDDHGINYVASINKLI